MICNLCKGAQNLLVIQDKRKEWFRCPFCYGFGSLKIQEPGEIAISLSQQKVVAKAEIIKKQ